MLRAAVGKLDVRARDDQGVADRRKLRDLLGLRLIQRAVGPGKHPVLPAVAD